MCGHSKGRNGHIRFRDSKLTRILQSSLGGNAKTAIICTMSPARSHVEQSRNTLLFASCAKEVTTNAQVNVFMSDKALVKHLQRELARLESELRGPGSSFVISHYSALLQDKELQIDKVIIVVLVPCCNTIVFKKPIPVMWKASTSKKCLYLKDIYIYIYIHIFFFF